MKIIFRTIIPTLPYFYPTLIFLVKISPPKYQSINSSPNSGSIYAFKSIAFPPNNLHLFSILISSTSSFLLLSLTRFSSCNIPHPLLYVHNLALIIIFIKIFHFNLSGNFFFMYIVMNIIFIPIHAFVYFI